MCDVILTEWEEKYAQDFKNSSLEWLEKYVSVEPEDLKIIDNPHESVLDNGGAIFFALYNGHVVGTVAMIKQNLKTYELAKLAVTEQYNGLKIGKRLMEKCLEFAKQSHAEKIILYTNQKLKPAIGLYKQYGFMQIPMQQNKYIEADMKWSCLLIE